MASEELTVEWLQTIRDLSILVTALVAAYGFDSWRREHTGKRRIELAEETLTLFYEAQDAITHIRSSFGFDFETKDLEQGDRETEEQFRARKNASVVFARYNSHKELFSKLHATRYRFMAQVGRLEAKPFDDMHTIVGEIFQAARILGRLWARKDFSNQESFEKHSEKIEKYEAVFWESMASPDPIALRVTTAINEMETTCRAIVEGQGTLFSWINKRVGFLRPTTKIE